MCPHISHRRGNAALSEILDKVDKKRGDALQMLTFSSMEGTARVATLPLKIALHLFTQALLLS